jgi:hypothetical protein
LTLKDYIFKMYVHDFIYVRSSYLKNKYENGNSH